MARVDAPRQRKNFARLKNVLDLPNLIDIQRRSFDWLVDPKDGGLRVTIDDISPIEDYTGNVAVEFQEFTFDEPVVSIEECREKDLTYARPLSIKVAFHNRETGEIREQQVFMGDFPWMTDRGTFVINGTERVVVTQLVRSPGAYVMEPKDAEKQVFIANLMPARGSWLELEVDKKGSIEVRIDRKRKLPVSRLLRALPEDETLGPLQTNEQLRALFERWDAESPSPEGVITHKDFLLHTLNSESTPGQPVSEPEVEAVAALSAKAEKLHEDFGKREKTVAKAKEAQVAADALKDLVKHWKAFVAKQVEPFATACEERDQRDLDDLVLNPESEYLDRRRTVIAAALEAGAGAAAKKGSETEVFADSVKAYKEHLAAIRGLAGHAEGDFNDYRDHTVTQSKIEIFKKQRPGEPPSEEAAEKLINALFFDPKRYNLSKVGRYKLNTRLGVDVEPERLTLLPRDIVSLVKALSDVPIELGVPTGENVKDYAEEAGTLPRERVQHLLDEYEHFGNRRLRTVGELIQDAFRIGLYRMERVVRERLTTEDADTITPQTIINIRPVVAAQKEFFGSSQLSQFMDQTNSLAGLTHRRRLSALGAGGLTRERAPIEVRDVHETHYGRMCPIETPEGPNIGLIGSLSSYATVSDYGFVQTPYRKVEHGVVTDDIVMLDASEEEQHIIAQADSPIDERSGKLQGPTVSGRSRDEEAIEVMPSEVTLMEVSPTQIWSVATALIPFLEHDDANRALMGSNMQRQAVPLLKTEAPLVGTGMEHRAAVDTGDVVVCEAAGAVTAVDAEQITVETGSKKREYPLHKFRRSNQGTLIHQKPIVGEGDKVAAGQVLADGSSTDRGELALGKNCLVAFMSWEGYNFEDAIIISERLVRDDVLTSIHIEEYEVDARTTKLGDEEITRDIPNRSEESLRNLDERGVVRIGAEVTSGDLLVGKVTPKGETELTAEEKLIRAIFKEKAREVRDTSLKVPHGEGGVVIDVKTFSREANDDLSPGVNELVRVFVATKRKIAEGDKLAGRHGNKGVISKIVPVADMPCLADGTPVDVILNPLGVPSRMNIGQILETHLGWAAAGGWYDDGGPEYKLAQRSDDKRVFVATPVFDGAKLEDVDDALVNWQEEHRDGKVQFQIDRKAPAGSRCSGKLRLFNGRTGEPYEGEITVGYMYILKLLHLVDDKIHARSTGPYSLVTQQPLGGKAQFGGQRFGEMEVWALEAYGAAYTLQEMLTIKSDDTVGRVKAYEAIVKGENIAEPSIPESFKVLVKEMQSLALNVDVVSVEGEGIEIREEEDDLLRAAEELGLDLAGVRATDKDGKPLPGTANDEREDEIVSGEIDGDVTSDEPGGEEKVGPGAEAGIVDESPEAQLDTYVEEEKK